MAREKEEVARKRREEESGHLVESRGRKEVPKGAARMVNSPPATAISGSLGGVFCGFEILNR